MPGLSRSAWSVGGAYVLCTSRRGSALARNKQGGIAVDRETGASDSEHKLIETAQCRWNGGGEERDQPGHQGPTCRCRGYCGTTAGPSMRNRRSRPPTSELGVGPLSLPRPRDGKCCSGARPRPPIEAGRRPRVRAASRAAGGARARKKKGGSDHGTGHRQWRRRATGPAAGSCGARWRWGQGRRGRGAWGA